MSKLKGKSVQVSNPIEYGVALASYLIAGANVWPWHKGYKAIDDGDTHHVYSWDDCGFLKMAGVLESMSGDYKSPFDLIDVVKSEIEELHKENLLLKSRDESLNLTRPNRPDLSSIPLEVVRYIESLEYGIDKVDSMCLKRAARCDELHEALDGLLGAVSIKGISLDNYIGADCRKSLQRAVDVLRGQDEI